MMMTLIGASLMLKDEILVAAEVLRQAREQSPCLRPSIVLRRMQVRHAYATHGRLDLADLVALSIAYHMLASGIVAPSSVKCQLRERLHIGSQD